MSTTAAGSGRTTQTRCGAGLFLGSENYDNRIDNGGLLDLEVLADLRHKYGPSTRP